MPFSLIAKVRRTREGASGKPAKVGFIAFGRHQDLNDGVNGRPRHQGCHLHVRVDHRP
jgi:hypothetical protein